MPMNQHTLAQDQVTVTRKGSVYKNEEKFRSVSAKH